MITIIMIIIIIILLTILLTPEVRLPMLRLGGMERRLNRAQNLALA